MRYFRTTASPDGLHLGLAVLVVAVTIGTTPASAQEASSDNYVMQVSGVAMAGGRSESATYRVADSVGLGVEGGEMESASYKAEGGILLLDADGDGVSGSDDLCPEEYSGCYDLDFDGCIDVPDVDDDGDGFTAGSCECDDGNGQVWATPGEVLDVMADKGSLSSTLLSWDPPAEPGGTMPRYDTVRSASASDFTAGAAVCVETDDAGDTSATDSYVPSPSEVVYYLVRAENDCASGTGPAGTTQGLYERNVRDCS